MNKDLTCSQVAALINFYLDGKLNPRLKEYVNLHLLKCPKCRKKVEDLKKILTKYSQIKKSINKEEIPINAEFRNNLSAYVDNELNSNENIKIKKIAISNPTARKELESMYKFQKIVHSAYEKTKNDAKFDYSKDILSKIQENKDYTTTYFYKLAIIFALIMTGIISGFIYLYF